MQAHLVAVPIHEYAPVQPPGCSLCCYGFERLQPAGEPALAQCPACGTALRRVPSAPQVVRGGAHRLQESHLARHGFTQYRRNGKGHYEKTVGEGPDTLADD